MRPVGPTRDKLWRTAAVWGLVCALAGCDTAPIEMGKSVGTLEELEARLTREADSWRVIDLASCDGEAMTVSFAGEGEVYAYQFAAKERDLLTVSMDGSPLTDTMLWLYASGESADDPADKPIDPRGAFVVDDDSGPGGLSGLAEVALPEATSFKLVLASWHETATGDLRLTMTLDGDGLCTKAQP